MKKILLLLISSFACFTLMFANDLHMWQKQYGERFDEHVSCAIQTVEGGFLLAGWTQSKGSGGKDGWVVKLTASGDVFFEKTFGGTKDDLFNSVVQDPNGGFLAVGQKVNEMSGYHEVWLVHFDEMGKKDWERKYGQTRYSNALQVIYTPDDKGFLLLASREEKGDHDMNAWWLKLNRKGLMQWQSISQKRYLNDECFDIVQTTDGGYISVGYVADKYKVKNLYITKVDKRGTQVWTQEYGGEKDDEALKILKDSDRSYVVVGNTSSKGSGQADGWAILIDDVGRIIKEQTYGGVGNDSLYAVTKTTDGFLISGKTESKGKGKSDTWLLNANFDLEQQWDYITGDDKAQETVSVLYDKGRRLCITVDNNYTSSFRDAVVTVYGDDLFDDKKRNPKPQVKVATVENSAKISITSPMVRRGFKTMVSERYTTVKGRVLSESKIESVVLNGKEAMLGQGGTFSADVPLNFGTNTVQVIAKDVSGAVYRKTFTVDRASEVKSGTDVSFQNDVGKYYALLIGVEDYSDEEINNLDKPIDDALMLYNTLTQYYTFEKEDVTVLKNPGRTDIILALDELSNRVTEKDNLLIFYAGHGYWDETKKLGYWLPADAMKSNTANWVRNSTIRDYVSAIHSKHTLLIADACFSGGIFKTRSAFNNSSKAFAMLHKLNSRKAMTSGTLKEVPDQSAFIKYLNKQLITNENNLISSEELFSLFRMAVINNSPNVPQYGTIKDSGDEGGEFIFMKR